MASTKVQNPLDENHGNVLPSNVKGSQKVEDLTRKNSTENRKTLQTLQYSTGAPISPIRKIVKPQKKNLIQKTQRPITVFVDPPLKKHDDKAIQTEKAKLGELGADALTSDEVPETYWRDLAEERRKALNESLHENEQLHKEVSELKEENRKLSEVAGQAEYFANVLKDVLGADEEDDGVEVLNSTDSDEEEICVKENDTECDNKPEKLEEANSKKESEEKDQSTEETKKSEDDSEKSTSKDNPIDP